MAFRNSFGGAGTDRTRWLMLLFLVLGVLAPTACVLWFMNEAARSQAESARQSVAEAYRGQLRLIRDQVDSFWAARAAALQAKSAGNAAPAFARIVTAGLADSAIVLNSDGAVGYPTPTSKPLPDPAGDRDDWLAAVDLEDRRDRPVEAAAAWARIAQGATDPSLAARAWQAHVRCLLQTGNTEAAIHTIQAHCTTGRAARGVDLHGRLIAADEQLLALRLMKAGDRRYAPAVERLAALLNDYESASMPAAQRLFLMDELAAPAFPTHRAEQLAAQVLDTDGAHPGNRALENTHVPDLWKLTAPGGRVLALYRTDTVLAATRGLLDQPSRNVRFAVLPPGAANSGESIAAGPLLPGWQVSFSLLGTQAFDETARRRMTSYLWVGYLVIAAMTLTGLLVGQSFRRQWRMARLKTDLIAAVSHEIKTPLASMRALVEALLEDEQASPRKTREYLVLIAKENLRLSRLIDNFLTFSRLERNRQKFDFAATAPAAVVEAAVESTHERFRLSGCCLEVSVSPGLPAVRADEDALVTVLLNLLDNAYKYTPGEKRIGLRAYDAGGRVVFAVEDNGIGIAPREQKKIFRRFYQVDRRLARDTGGCGLGLSIVEFIVRAHGGSVAVESHPGKGSTFSVSLPSIATAKGAAA